MDYFFAAVALRKYPQYKNHPVAIGHSNIKKNTTDHQINNHHLRKVYRHPHVNCQRTIIMHESLG